MATGSPDRKKAENLPSAASALIFRRILKRWRMVADRFSRISLKLPPVEP